MTLIYKLLCTYNDRLLYFRFFTILYRSTQTRWVISFRYEIVRKERTGILYGTFCRR